MLTSKMTVLRLTFSAALPLHSGSLTQKESFTLRHGLFRVFSSTSVAYMLSVLRMNGTIAKTCASRKNRLNPHFHVVEGRSGEVP